jgi:hypothetical protein
MMAQGSDVQIECYPRLRWLTKSLKLFLSFAFYCTYDCMYLYIHIYVYLYQSNTPVQALRAPVFLSLPPLDLHP